MTTKQSLLVILLSQSVLLTACLDVEMAMQIDPNSNAEPATQQVVKEAVPEIKQIVETQIYANDEIAYINISDFNPAGLLVHLESSDLIYNASSSLTTAMNTMNKAMSVVNITFGILKQVQKSTIIITTMMKTGG